MSAMTYRNLTFYDRGNELHSRSQVVKLGHVVSDVHIGNCVTTSAKRWNHWKEDYDMIKRPTRSISFLTMLAMTGTLMLLSQSVLAAECKGMEKSACEGQSACTWVDSYKRKDGVQVNGYCRNKGGKKSSSSSDSSS